MLASAEKNVEVVDDVYWHAQKADTSVRTRNEDEWRRTELIPEFPASWSLAAQFQTNFMKR